MIRRLTLALMLLLPAVQTTTITASYAISAVTRQQAIAIATKAICNLFGYAKLDAAAREKIDTLIADFTKNNFTFDTNYQQMNEKVVIAMVIEQSLQWICNEAMNTAIKVVLSNNDLRPYFTGQNQSEQQALRQAIHKAVLAQTERVRKRGVIYENDLQAFIGQSLTQKVTELTTEIVNRDCAIPFCDGHGKAKLLPCGHKLHTECRNQLQKQKCPLCSEDLGSKPAAPKPVYVQQSRPQVAPPAYTNNRQEQLDRKHSHEQQRPVYTQPVHTNTPQTDSRREIGFLDALFAALFGASNSTAPSAPALSQWEISQKQANAQELATQKIRLLFDYSRLDNASREKASNFINDFNNNTFKSDTNYAQMNEATITKLVIEQSLQWICTQATTIATQQAMSNETFRLYFTGANQSELVPLRKAINKSLMTQTERVQKQATIYAGDLFGFIGYALEQKVVAQMTEIINRDCGIPYCDGHGKAKLLPCGHKLHDDCLSQLKPARCPQCRDDVSELQNNARNKFNL